MSQQEERSQTKETLRLSPLRKEGRSTHTNC